MGSGNLSLNILKGKNTLIDSNTNTGSICIFNDNIIEEYTYEDSIVDGVNVPNRVYRIKTEQTDTAVLLKKEQLLLKPLVTVKSGLLYFK